VAQVAIDPVRSRAFASSLSPSGSSRQAERIRNENQEVKNRFSYKIFPEKSSPLPPGRFSFHGLPQVAASHFADAEHLQPGHMFFSEVLDKVRSLDMSLRLIALSEIDKTGTFRAEHIHA